VTVEKVVVARAKTASPAGQAPPAQPRKSASAGETRKPAPGLIPITVNKSAEQVRRELGDFMTPPSGRAETASEKAASDDEVEVVHQESPMEKRSKANLKAKDEAGMYDEEEEEEEEAPSKKVSKSFLKAREKPLIPSDDDEDVEVVGEEEESSSGSESGSSGSESESSKSSVESSREWKPQDHGKSESQIRRQKLEKQTARSNEKAETNRRNLEKKDLSKDPNSLRGIGRIALESRQRGRKLLDTLNAIPDEVFVNAKQG
jgi:hypothetical protein